MTNQASLDPPAIQNINPCRVMYGVMHALKTRFAHKLSCFLGTQMTNIFKETSGIIPTSNWLNVDPPKRVHSGHLEVEQAQDKDNPIELVFGRMLNTTHLPQCVNPLFCGQVTM